MDSGKEKTTRNFKIVSESPILRLHWHPPHVNTHTAPFDTGPTVHRVSCAGPCQNRSKNCGCRAGAKRLKHQRQGIIATAMFFQWAWVDGSLEIGNLLYKFTWLRCFVYSLELYTTESVFHCFGVGLVAIYPILINSTWVWWWYHNPIASLNYSKLFWEWSKPTGWLVWKGVQRTAPGDSCMVTWLHSPSCATTLSQDCCRKEPDHPILQSGILGATCATQFSNDIAMIWARGCRNRNTGHPDASPKRRTRRYLP